MQDLVKKMVHSNKRTYDTYVQFLLFLALDNSTSGLDQPSDCGAALRVGECLAGSGKFGIDPGRNIFQKESHKGMSNSSFLFQAPFSSICYRGPRNVGLTPGSLATPKGFPEKHPFVYEFKNLPSKNGWWTQMPT